MDSVVRRAQSGDADALREVCVRYHPRLCRYLCALTRSKPDAEDLAQETLLRMLQNIDGFRGLPGASFDAWVFRIARNLFLSGARAKRPVSLPEDYDPPDTGPTPERALDMAQRSEKLRRAMEGLDDELREMVALRYETEMSYRDIAKTLGTTSVRVAWRLHDALGKLKKRLEQEGETKWTL